MIFENHPVHSLPRGCRTAAKVIYCERVHTQGEGAYLVSAKFISDGFAVGSLKNLIPILSPFLY